MTMTALRSEVQPRSKIPVSPPDQDLRQNWDFAGARTPRTPFLGKSKKVDQKKKACKPDSGGYGAGFVTRFYTVSPGKKFSGPLETNRV